MNRTDRLLALVLELQARSYTRAEDLANQFEVTVRTIYRDMLALCEAGVPVVSTPGRGYSLAPGYFLPPLMLTPDEAGMLLLGAAFVAEQVDAPYCQVTDTARKKIEKLLPEATHQELEFLRDTLRFSKRPRPLDPSVKTCLPILRQAIMDRSVLHLAYHARHGDPGVRDVEPHGLVCLEGIWILAAYCRTRREMRHFRLDRIDKVTPIGERFTRRQEFTVRRITPMTYGPDEVHVLVSPEVLRWARESRPVSFVREEDDPMRGMIMVFRPHTSHELIPWLLSWGSGVHVLSPAAMQRQIAEIAQATARLYAHVE